MLESRKQGSQFGDGKDGKSVYRSGGCKTAGGADWMGGGGGLGWSVTLVGV
jgi:hypothetical protein